MYKIIGADQKEYGPVNSEQIRHWVRDGRLNAQSRAQRDGGEWLPLSAFEEFADLFQPPAPAPSAPPLSGSSPAIAPAPMPSAGPIGSRDAAIEAVRGPAIALIATSSIGIAIYLIRAAMLLIVGGALMHRQLPSDVPPEVRDMIAHFQGPLGAMVCLFAAALNALVLLGAIKMLRLQSYGLAFAACIVAMIPCSCCCVLGLPFGVWGLVMLNKPEVKSQF